MSGRRPAPRPKRAGETFARTHHGQINNDGDDDDGPSSKRVRFDIRNPSALAPEAPEEDAILELDEIGKGGQQAKRNAVNLDGYESDSSNEGFDARVEARAKKTAGNTGDREQADQNDMFADLEDDFRDEGDDEELSREGKKSKRDEIQNDMFADLDDDFKVGVDDAELSREGKKSKREVRFLDEHEIGGQVMGSKGGGHVSADFSLNGNGIGKGKNKAKAYESSSESDEEGGDDDQEVDEEVGAGGKKIHAPKLSAFHMKEELEEGRFDAQGNFVRKAADPDAVHDTWLEGISKKDRRRAREAEEKREEERRQRRLEEDQVLTSDVLKTLIPRLERGETVLEALARLGTGNKEKKKKTKTTPRWKIRRKQNQGDAEVEMQDVQDVQEEDPVETQRRQDVEAITGAADLLLTRGQNDIYEDTREVLMRQYRRETGEDWVDRTPGENVDADDNDHQHPHQTKRWEYRWIDARDDGTIHGPYDGENMRQWQDAGYFGEGVEFRRTMEGGAGDWSRSVDFV